MPTELKEVVPPAHTLHPQHLRPDPRQRLFHLPTRRLVLPLALRFDLRQRLPVHLAVAVERQLLQPHDRRGHHVLGQALAQLSAQFSHVDGRAFAGRDVGEQACSCFALLGHHHGFSHPGLRQQLRLDLSQLDAESSDLHLVVQPPEELQPSVGAPAHQVARAVQPRTAGRLVEGVGHEAFCRQRCTPCVAAG
ncbi:hypothetical protein D3C71_1154910 [compost metagenome]